MGNLKEQAKRLQKCIAENGTLKKSFVITKQKLETWKLIKQKNESGSEKEQLDNFKNNKIQLFKKGQYSNSTHAAYQDLINFAGVSANKVDKVVDIVLTQIAMIQVDRLAKSTFAEDMAIESRGVTQYQIASELSGFIS